jgi:hypothetical protein
MDSDPINAYTGLCTCPVCGCLDRKGVYRCHECGTFHAGSIMEEREPPEVAVPEKKEPLDPSIYSLGPGAPLPEESFEESEDVTSWEGGSTDFSFEDDDEPPALISKSDSLAVDVLHDED